MADRAGTAPERGAELSPLARMQAILGGSAGNLVEWYDWFAYSSFALYFAPHFFPKGDQTAQLLQAAAVFAIGFLARPAGAWLMGLYADWRGRRAALTVSVAMMSAGSFAIALIPDYAVIGVGAPALLVAARLVQGLSLGGEYGASATYMTEMAGRRRRGLWSSFQFLTLIAGQLCALGVLIVLQGLLPEADLLSYLEAVLRVYNLQGRRDNRTCLGATRRGRRDDGFILRGRRHHLRSPEVDPHLAQHRALTLSPAHRHSGPRCRRRGS